MRVQRFGIQKESKQAVAGIDVNIRCGKRSWEVGMRMVLKEDCIVSYNE